MGQKAKFKKIRQAANQLPVIFRNTHEKHIRTGLELIEDNVTEIDGVKVNPLDNYIEQYPVQIAINHNRKMKQMYKKYGPFGIGAYIHAVADYQDKNKTA